MIKDGVGGAKTKTGLKFKAKVELSEYIASHKGYKISKIDGYRENTAFNVLFNNVPVAKIFKKAGVKQFLENEYTIIMENILSSVMLPNNSIFVNHNNTFFVIEIKYQQCAGSTDEKLQTCDFKKKQWEKVMSQINWKVKYFYILNDWFKNPRYNDMLDYIKSIKECNYYFDSIPLNELGLKTTKLKTKNASLFPQDLEDS